jgi:hypothetical protein
MYAAQLYRPTANARRYLFLLETFIRPIFIFIFKEKFPRIKASHPIWQTSGAFGISEKSPHAMVSYSTCHFNLPIKMSKPVLKPYFISYFLNF